MNKEDFLAIQIGKITSKNYRKHGLSKSLFYKTYARVKFYKEITDPIKFCVLNLSQREFLATRNSKLKIEIPGKSSPPSFHMSGKNKVNDIDPTDD